MNHDEGATPKRLHIISFKSLSIDLCLIPLAKYLLRSQSRSGVAMRLSRPNECERVTLGVRAPSDSRNLRDVRRVEVLPGTCHPLRQTSLIYSPSVLNDIRTQPHLDMLWLGVRKAARVGQRQQILDMNDRTGVCWDQQLGYCRLLRYQRCKGSKDGYINCCGFCLSIRDRYRCLTLPRCCLPAHSLAPLHVCLVVSRRPALLLLHAWIGVFV